MESTKAMALASSFLQASGFQAKAQQAFQMGGDWNVLEMTRGKPRQRSPSKCFQQVRFEFDRGRMSMAATILPLARKSFGVVLSSASTMDLKPTSKAGKPYTDLMLALALAMDQLLAQGKSTEEVMLSWREAESFAGTQFRRRKRRTTIIAVLIFALIFLPLIALILWASLHH
jgi:hypothetical protein